MKNRGKPTLLLIVTMFATIAALGFPALAQISADNESAAAGDVIPSDFKGKITYAGSYSRSVAIVPRAGTNPSRGARTESFQGNLTYEISYNGPKFTGNYSEPGGNFRTSGTFKGTRSGQICQVEFDNGMRVTATCGLTRFSIVTTFAGDWGRKTDVTVDLKQAAIVDFAELDRKKAATDAERWKQTASAFAGNAARTVTPASGEELRLEALCNKSQWASCEPYARLRAPRLLKNCEAGDLDACYSYASSARSNAGRQFNIWYVPKALPAMKIACEHWQTTTNEGWNYADRCEIRDILERKVRFDSIPANISATSKEQRSLCISRSDRVIGYETRKTGVTGRNSEGDYAEQTESVPVMEFTFKNNCKFPVKARCSSATFDLSNNIITLAPSQSTTACQLLYVQ